MSESEVNRKSIGGQSIGGQPEIHRRRIVSESEVTSGSHREVGTRGVHSVDPGDEGRSQRLSQGVWG